MFLYLPLLIINLLLGTSDLDNPQRLKTYALNQEEQAFLEDLKQRTFQFFWDTADPQTWQSDDRYPNRTFSSIAATGFALPAYIIGAENGYVSRAEAAERVWKVLHWMDNAPKGPQASGVAGYKGFFYHFLNNESGDRFKEVELSTIDTGLLMAGVLTAIEYFDANDAVEEEIRSLGDRLFRQVVWQWAMNGNETMSMGWKPESGFLEAQWTGYNEAMILLIMAMGSPTHPIDAQAWTKWTDSYQWSDFQGFAHINFGPLFGHQYSQMFIDFRDIQDPYTRQHHIDYFENSRLASLANRAYAIENPSGFADYSSTIWGLTACDGPGDQKKQVNGRWVDFFSYRARGAAEGYIVDDGTIAPTAAGGSIPFTPEHSIPALMAMKQKYGDKVYREYGFVDAFNPSWSPEGWFAPDYLGIDQGAILIQLENFQSQLIWKLLSNNSYIKTGLKKAGFDGGWLAEQP